MIKKFIKNVGLIMNELYLLLKCFHTVPSGLFVIGCNGEFVDDPKEDVGENVGRGEKMVGTVELILLAAKIV